MKKLIAVLLALVLAVSLVPAALAAPVEHKVTAENCYIIIGEYGSEGNYYTSEASYKEGDVVQIAFSVLDYFHKEDMGRRFDHWEVTPSYVTINADDTFIMPDEDVTIVGVAQRLTKITVDPGSGPYDDHLFPNDTKNLTAKDPPEGQVFDHWEVVSGNMTLEDPTNPRTSFTVGTEDVVIKAVFKSADALKFIGSLKLEPADGKVANGGEFKVSFQLNRPAEEIYIEYQNEYGNWIECGILGNEDPVQSGTKTYSSDQWEDCTVKFRLHAANDGENGYSDPFTVTFGGGAKTTHWNVTPSLTVYESADRNSDDYFKYIGSVPQGAEVTVLETQGERSKIIFKDGYGWVYSEFLRPVGEKLNPFLDISKSDQWYDAVLWAYYAEPQVTNGVDAAHFGPTQTVTRGQCAAFLWRAMGEPEPTNIQNPFVDVPASQYYYKPILWAVEKGITKGTDATHFSPDQTLSTAHIITFLYRAKNPGADGWWAGAAYWATKDYASGEPFGVVTPVHPNTDCPRGYVVMFLQKACQ